MAMKTDTRRFVNFLLLVLGMSGMVYLFYVKGVFAELTEKNQEYGSEIEDYKKLYKTGEPRLEELCNEYMAADKVLASRLESTTRQISIQFADYCNFPPVVHEKKRYGFWFFEQHSKVRDDLLRMCKPEGTRPAIQFEDTQLGLGFDQTPADMPEKRAQDMLRQLSIAEKIIKLLIEAYREQFTADGGKKGTTFLQIVRVIPEELVRTGAVKLRKNPAYKPDVARSEKYDIQRYREFIDEYPVEITVVCDMNTLIRFLHSVRKPDQFLVLRKLQVLAPGIHKSMEGGKDLEMLIEVPAGGGKSRRVELDMDLDKQERLRVLITAAGMKFRTELEDTSKVDRKTLRLQRGTPPTPAGM